MATHLAQDDADFVQAVGLVLLGAGHLLVEVQGLPVGVQGLLMATHLAQDDADFVQAVGLALLSVG